MSTYTVEVDKFLSDVIYPELDRLNVSLLNMETNGYESKMIKDTRKKISSLGAVRTFLAEYANGNEEVDYETLKELMVQVGTQTQYAGDSVSVQSTRNSLIPNLSEPLYPFVRVYINGKIQSDDTIIYDGSDLYVQIYSDTSTVNTVLGVSITGLQEQFFSGDRFITTGPFNISAASSLSLNITTYDSAGERLNTTINYNIVHTSCEQFNYFIGSTTEPFTIGQIDINETTTITIDPNSGTNSAGTLLDFNWVSQNLQKTSYKRELTVSPGDRHALVVFPSTQTVVGVKEAVGGTLLDLNYGYHYDVFNIMNVSDTYTVLYLRDLANYTFTNPRVFIVELTSI